MWVRFSQAFVRRSAVDLSGVYVVEARRGSFFSNEKSGVDEVSMELIFLRNFSGVRSRGSLGLNSVWFCLTSAMKKVSRLASPMAKAVWFWASVVVPRNDDRPTTGQEYAMASPCAAAMEMREPL